MTQPETGCVWHAFSLVLLDDKGMTEVNTEFRGRDRSTDVLAFAYNPMPGDAGGRRGEVLVNAPRAWHTGDRYGGRDRELARYITHGLLHLQGHADDTPALRARIRRKENALLASCGPLTAPGALFSLPGCVDKHDV